MSAETTLAAVGVPMALSMLSIIGKRGPIEQLIAMLVWLQQVGQFIVIWGRNTWEFRVEMWRDAGEVVRKRRAQS